MSEPTDIEDRIRAILKDYAADSEHLLDEVKEEYAGELLRSREHWKARAEKSENSLSALREAVGKYLKAEAEVIRAADSLEPHVSTRDVWEEYEDALANLESAHDAAPMPHEHWFVTSMREQSAKASAEPPTLTLEEVQVATDELLTHGVAADVRPGVVVLCAKLRELIAQKGAGRG